MARPMTGRVEIRITTVTSVVQAPVRMPRSSRAGDHQRHNEVKRELVKNKRLFVAVPAPRAISTATSYVETGLGQNFPPTYRPNLAREVVHRLGVVTR